MHSRLCSPTNCFCPFPPSPETTITGQDILLLRAKLAQYFFSESANDVSNIVNRNRCLNACPDATKRSWPPPESTSRNGKTGSNPDQKRHYTLDSMTWDVKRVASEAEARKLAKNPPLECGGGIVLWGKYLRHIDMQCAN